MTAEQRLRFQERLNTAEIRRPILNSVSSENHATGSAISIKPGNLDIVYPSLPITHQIFNKAEKYVYSSPDSIKSSAVDGNMPCSLIAASASSPDSPHVVKFNSSGKNEYDVNCIRCKSYKICSHTVAAAEHKLELRNFVEYFKKHSKNKVNDLLMLICLQRLGRRKLKVHKRENESLKFKAVILHQQCIYLQQRRI